MRLLTRALPLALLACASFAWGVYQSGAAARSQRALVTRYAHAWSHGDIAVMYAMLDAASRRGTSQRSFVAQLGKAAQTATLRSLQVLGVAGPSNGWVAVRTRVRTRLFGTLKETLEVPIGSDGSSIRFASTLLFPGLAPGEALRRRSVLGPRGALLADDGTALAEGPQRASPIPSVAAEVAGKLGPIPSEETAEYATLGYPANAQVGIDGLEQVFQSQLAGQIGGTLLAGRRILASAAARAGEDVRTTIDPRIETAAINALGSSYAAMTVMDPRTGALLALAGFAYSDVQPPGSTMKIVTTAGA